MNKNISTITVLLNYNEPESIMEESVNHFGTC